MRGHVDAEALAAFREDLLPRRKAARVSAHLAACPRCAGLDAQLAEVTTLLSRSVPAPMPAALAARIEAALAAEAAARSATAAGSAPVAAGGAMAAGAPAAGPAMDGLRAAGPRADMPEADGPQPGAGRDRAGGRRRAARFPGRGRSGLVLRIAAATAAVAVLGGGGYGVARLLSGNPAVLGAASAPAAHRAVGLVPGGNGAGGASAQRAAAPSLGISSYPVLHTGTNYQPGRLAAQIGAVLGRHRNKASNEPAAPQPFFAPLSSCVARVAPQLHPRLVDVAYYRGRPAAVIVVPGTSRGTLRVIVVGVGCTGTGTGTDLLHSATVPAPR